MCLIGLIGVKHQMKLVANLNCRMSVYCKTKLCQNVFVPLSRGNDLFRFWLWRRTDADLDFGCDCGSFCTEEYHKCAIRVWAGRGFINQFLDINVISNQILPMINDSALCCVSFKLYVHTNTSCPSASVVRFLLVAHESRSDNRKDHRITKEARFKSSALCVLGINCTANIWKFYFCRNLLWGSIWLYFAFQ